MPKYSKILVSQTALDNLSKSESLRSLGLDSDDKIQQFFQEKFSKSHVGTNLEKLEGGNIFSGRLGGRARFFLVYVEVGEGSDKEIVPYIIDANNHEYAEFERSGRFKKFTKSKHLNIAELSERFIKCDLGKKINIIIAPPLEDEVFAAKKSVFFFDADQDDALERMTQSYRTNSNCINAIAGSGKTLVGLNWLANVAAESLQAKKFVYLTKSAALAQRQQEEFARLFPNQVGKVEFLSHSEFIRKTNQLADNQEIAQYKDFCAWYESVKANSKTDALNQKKYDGKKPFPANLDLYYEFCHLAGNFENADQYKAAQINNCNYPNTQLADKINRNDVLKMYDLYKNYLQEKQLIDPLTAVLQNPDGQYADIIVDEAELFTKAELRQIHGYSEAPLQYLYDVNQGPTTFHPEVHLYLDDNYIKNPERTLNTHYRSSPAVISCAQYILNNLRTLYKGVRHFSDAATTINAADDSKVGDVDFCELKPKLAVKDDFMLYEEEIKKNPHLYAIIVPNQNIKEQVKGLFGKGITVMSINECHGLEYPRVIIYKCLHPSLKIDANNDNSIDQISQLRKLFLATTRAEESVVVMNPSSDFFRKWQESTKKFQKDFQTKPSRVRVLSDRSKIKDELLIISNHIKAAIALKIASAQDANNQIEVAINKLCELSQNADAKTKENLKAKLDNFITFIGKNYPSLKGDDELYLAILSEDIKVTGARIDAYLQLFQSIKNPQEIAAQTLKNIDLNLNVTFSIIKYKKGDVDFIGKILKDKKCDEKYRRRYWDLLQNQDLNAEQLKVFLEFIDPDFNEIINQADQLELENPQFKARTNIIFDYLLAEKNNQKTNNSNLIINHLRAVQKDNPKIPILDILDEKQTQALWSGLVNKSVQNQDLIWFILKNHHQKLFANPDNISSLMSEMNISGNGKYDFISILVDALYEINPEILEVEIVDKKSKTQQVCALRQVLDGQSYKAISKSSHKLLDSATRNVAQSGKVDVVEIKSGIPRTSPQPISCVQFSYIFAAGISFGSLVGARNASTANCDNFQQDGCVSAAVNAVASGVVAGVVASAVATVLVAPEVISSVLPWKRQEKWQDDGKKGR